MNRLDQEPDVVALARELGLPDDPVEAVVRLCEERAVAIVQPANREP